MTEKTRYSDEELAEFKELILKKLAVAREEYESIMGRTKRNNKQI